MSSLDKSSSSVTKASRATATKTTTTRKTISGSSSKAKTPRQSQSSSLSATSAVANKNGEKTLSSTSSTTSSNGKNIVHSTNKNRFVIDADQRQQRRPSTQAQRSHEQKPNSTASNQGSHKGSAGEHNGETSGSSQEMTMTNIQDGDRSTSTNSQHLGGNIFVEQETNIDRPSDGQETDDDESTLLESCSSDVKQPPSRVPSITNNDPSSHGAPNSLLPAGWEEHSDKAGAYFWHVATGVIQRTRPTQESIKQLNKDSIVLYHDDEEINHSSATTLLTKTSSDEDEFLESGAALTMADDPTLSDNITFVVYPVGCCEFDETQLISANSSRAIQKCILKLLNQSSKEERMCWSLDQSQPILMRLLNDHIQFTDVNSQSLLRSQPMQTIKTWAVDDDNNFAFVVEDQPHDSSRVGQADVEQAMYDSVDYALLNGPTFMCYVFSSMDDDNMSCKVAAKLNEEINRYREQMSNRISESMRLQQMTYANPPHHRQPSAVGNNSLVDNDQTDSDEELDDLGGDGNEDDDLAGSSEMSLNVRYIGNVNVPRPMGIDMLNVAIDKCLANASKAQMNRMLSNSASTTNSPIDFDSHLEIGSPLTDAKIHVSPSSVIVEDEQTGEIIVECRIRYLTFMGISRRDIRWCGFIMQRTTNKTFVAHCFECHPTAGRVCEAIQTSCSRMYEKMMMSQQQRKQQANDAIIPRSSKIRDTLAKTLSKIKLAPIIQ